MGRHAVGDEIPCGKGRCRNLAEWTIAEPAPKNYPSRRKYAVCNLHLDPELRRLKEVNRYVLGEYEVLPFQDASTPPSRKRKRLRDTSS